MLDELVPGVTHSPLTRLGAMTARPVGTPHIQHAATDLRQFIMRIDGALDAKLADQIVDVFGQSDLYSTSRVGDKQRSPTVRSSRQLNIPKVAMAMGTGPARSAARKLSNAHYEWMDEYRAFSKSHVHLDRFTAPNLVRYDQGEFFTKHSDAKPGKSRTVSVVALLPSDFIGGHFRFFDDEEPYPLRSGDVVLFPSNFLFPHSVSEILSGVRLSIVSFMF